jgi:hypothetical protein
MIPGEVIPSSLVINSTGFLSVTPVLPFFDVFFFGAAFFLIAILMAKVFVFSFPAKTRQKAGKELP